LSGKVLDGINNRLAFCVPPCCIGRSLIKEEKKLITVFVGKGGKLQIAGKGWALSIDCGEDLFELIIGKGQVFCENLLLAK
jgi:hypothetical protein